MNFWLGPSSRSRPAAPAAAAGAGGAGGTSAGSATGRSPCGELRPLPPIGPMLFSTFTLCGVALLAALPATFRAQPTGTPEHRSDLVQAVVSSPALQAAARRSTAARERVGAAGRLADVEVEGMGSRTIGPLDERATKWEVNVRQPLPRRGERDADRARAQAGVTLAEAAYAALAGELAAESAIARAEADAAEARARLYENQIGRLQAVLGSVEARLAAGGGRIADRLLVQSRVAAMQLVIEEERKTAADALAEARARLGLRPEAPLPGFAAPAPKEIRTEEAATVRLAAARTAEADAMGQVARTAANPLMSVGVRLERERRTLGPEHTAGLAFTTELPFRGRHYARAEIRAAAAERAAATSDADAARYRISSALTRVERAERLAATSRRLSEETVARLDAEYDALVRAAGVGSGGVTGDSTVLQTVGILERVADAGLQVIRAEAAVRTAHAELWRHVPASQFPAGQ